MNVARTRLTVQFAASLALILMFANMDAYTLFLLLLGAGIMALGFYSYYRPGAVLGLLLVAISAVESAEFDTLVEVRTLLTAVLGLMLPLSLLTLFALSSELEERSRHRQRLPAVVAGAYAAVCVCSVPLTVAAVGLVLPSVTAKFSVLTEVAIVLLFASVGATLLTSRAVEPG